MQASRQESSSKSVSIRTKDLSDVVNNADIEKGLSDSEDSDTDWNDPDPKAATNGDVKAHNRKVHEQDENAQKQLAEAAEIAAADEASRRGSLDESTALDQIAQGLELLDVSSDWDATPTKKVPHAPTSNGRAKLSDDDLDDEAMGSPTAVDGKSKRPLVQLVQSTGPGSSDASSIDDTPNSPSSEERDAVADLTAPKAYVPKHQHQRNGSSFSRDGGLSMTTEQWQAAIAELGLPHHDGSHHDSEDEHVENAVSLTQ